MGIAAALEQAQPWTNEQDKLLGTDTDENVARVLGRSIEGVAKQRVNLGIKARRKRGWTEAEDKLLGVLGDREVSARTGRTLPAIAQRRFYLGIPAAGSHG